ncbi:cytochrome P450 3A30 [Lindgomyces ingoldianus]|uniref:Cytochrome P450 3A30 n=1 Tax=Lindgomyces ingoldianus TaxID=673940 RepID=A0ACB6QKI0_9PLEO|nr:cytochrome P450 3A30 [Lindgomyces ingoldianus]KAF2467469.1 cytochrome P450 3A30 [Lindgomyces ingoldianus]
MEPSRGQSWLTIGASAAAAAFAYLVIKFIQHRRFYKDLPKPPYDFIWGHLKLMGEITSLFPSNCHVQVYITTISRKYKLPGLWYLDLWPLGPTFLVITDPDLALYITVQKNHPKHPVEQEFIAPIVGENNIVAAEGPAWKYLHNMLAPPFAISAVRNLAEMMSEEVMVFRSTLHKLAKTREVFRLEDISSNLTFDVVAKATFGFSLNAQTKGNPAIHDFSEICRAFVIEKNSWNFVKKFFATRKRKSATKRLDSQLEKMIRERFVVLQRDNVDVSQKRGLSIADLILRERINEGRDLNPEFMETAITSIKTMLLGGTGTTTDTVCFIFMLLSVHPEIVEKLREEHDRVFTPGIDATYAMIQDSSQKLSELTYTTNVIKETLRFYPVGNTARGEDATGFVTYKGQQYSTKGHIILPVQHSMQNNPDVFPNPKAFDPDRFTREDFIRHAWRPFERGPRACLGQALAMDELRIILLLTVREFDFQCADIKPNRKPRVEWTDLDVTFGDRAFQEFIFEAKPRDGMKMTVRESGKGVD